MTRYTYDEALKLDELRLGGNVLLVETVSNNYASVQQGTIAYKVFETENGYEVRTTVPNALEDQNEPVVKVEGDQLNYKIHKDNLYNGPEWVTHDITDKDKQRELLRAFKAVVESQFTFGGPAPYVNFSTAIYAETTEAKPIGQAEIGKNLIIG